MLCVVIWMNWNGALDDVANPIEKGNLIGSFVSLLPFVSTSIIEVSPTYGKYAEIAQITGSLFSRFSAPKTCKLT